MDSNNIQNYIYLNLMIENSFKNLSNDIINQKKLILSNIKKILDINENNINKSTILEKINIDNKICYIDNNNKLIYSKEATVIGKITDKNYIFYV